MVTTSDVCPALQDSANELQVPTQETIETPELKMEKSESER